MEDEGLPEVFIEAGHHRVIALLTYLRGGSAIADPPRSDAKGVPFETLFIASSGMLVRSLIPTVCPLPWP